MTHFKVGDIIIGLLTSNVGIILDITYRPHYNEPKLKIKYYKIQWLKPTYSCYYNCEHIDYKDFEIL